MTIEHGDETPREGFANLVSDCKLHVHSRVAVTLATRVEDRMHTLGLYDRDPHFSFCVPFAFPTLFANNRSSKEASTKETLTTG